MISSLTRRGDVEDEFAIVWDRTRTTCQVMTKTCGAMKDLRRGIGDNDGMMFTNMVGHIAIGKVSQQMDTLHRTHSQTGRGRYVAR